MVVADLTGVVFSAKAAAVLALTLSLLSTIAYWRSHRRAARPTGSTGPRSAGESSVRWFRYVFRFVQWIVPIASVCILLDRPAWALAWPVAPGTAAAGMAIATLGFGLFGWSKACLGKAYAPCFATESPEEIVVQGPYRFIRHPIYTANTCALLGLAIGTGSGWIGLAGLLVTMGYLVSAPREEHALLAQHPRYSELMAQTGRFLPKVRRHARAG